MVKIIRLLLIFLTLVLPSVAVFFKPGFFWTQDIIYLTRMSVAFNALLDHQLPIRWISGLRYGEPLFNYYAPLPYYFSSIIRFLTPDYLTVAKIAFIAISLFSAYFMYLLAKELWGSFGGLISAVLYAYAPYRALDVYTRGAYSEIFAFVWVPLIFWTAIKYLKTKNKLFWLGHSLALSLLITTHNLTAFMFLIFYISFIVFYIACFKKIRPIISLGVSFLLGLGLSAYYWIPAIFEKHLVKSEVTKLPLDNFVNQFVKLNDFFIPAKDQPVINHHLGLIYLLLFGISIVFLLIPKSKILNRRFLGIFTALFTISLFFQLKISLPLWLLFEPLNYLQFPWRFSGFSMFFISLAGGSFFSGITNRYSKLFTLFSTVLIIFFQTPLFKTSAYKNNVQDSDYLHYEEEYLPKEYLPLSVRQNPPVKIENPVDSQTYQSLPAKIIQSNSRNYHFQVSVNKNQEIVLPIYYFDGWTALINNQKTNLSKQSKTGLIMILLNQGPNNVILKFENNSLRSMADFITVGSIILFIFLFGKLWNRRLANFLPT